MLSPPKKFFYGPPIDNLTQTGKKSQTHSWIEEIEIFGSLEIVLMQTKNCHQEQGKLTIQV